MLRWAVIFLVVALIAAVLGFGGIAGTAAHFAIILFWIAVVVAVVMFLFGAMGGRSTLP
jgi:uncharacterized membrane protein YtjA (UPF0391 family)